MEPGAGLVLTGVLIDRRPAAVVAPGRGPPQRAADALATTLVWFAFLVVLVPLVWLIGLVVKNGAAASTCEFLTFDMRNVVGAGGGIYHALWGTILITLATALISIPIGLFTAIFLVEYGRGSRLARVDDLPGRRDDRHPLDRGRPLRALPASSWSSDRRSGSASVARSRCRC